MAFIPVYILILFFTILIDYYAGIFLERTRGPGRKRYLILSIISNLSVLAVFKYYNFFIDNVNSLISIAGVSNHPLPFLNIILPVGLSFHTFQAMSYTFEVYRGNQKAEKHLGIFALYVMFYPQLLAGPIERPQNMLHQFRENHSFNYDNVTTGLKFMLWGFFKKCVVADRLSSFVDPVFAEPGKYSGTIISISMIFYAFQIFCDFSGYSDIAIGSARVMGFNLMQNFNRPYSAKTISEFWQRWHISLSTWFRDYLYIPLGGNRVSVLRWYLNLFVVFLISGLWHGANWTFIAWGALHGTYIVLANIFNSMNARIAKAMRTIYTSWLYNTLQISITFILVTIAWVFFRATSISKAINILHLAAGIIPDMGHWLLKGELWLHWPVKVTEVLIMIAAILSMESVSYFNTKHDIQALLKTKPVFVRLTVYYLAIMAIMLFGVFDKRQFIYFQF